MATATVALQPRARAKANRARIAWIVLAVTMVVLVVGYLGISAYVADKLSKPDRKTLASTPAAYGMKYEDVSFKSTDGIALSGWYIDSPGDRAIVMMHGRGMTRDRDEAFLEKAQLFYGQGYDLLMFDFRAHGLSSGERYALGGWETRDVAGALSLMKERGHTEVGTYGVSMGAGISLLSAPERPEIKALWVDSAFADMQALIDMKLSSESGLPAFFNPGVLLMGKVLYDLDFSNDKPVEAIAKLKDRPIYQVYSRDGDDTIPLDQARALEAAAAGNPNYTVWAAPGKGHVAAYTNNKDEYTKRMVEFYAKYLR